MDSRQIILEYNQRWQVQLKAFRVKVLIFGLFLTYVVSMLALAFNVDGIGRELVLLTFIAPMILVGLIVYDLKKSRVYSCPQCSVNLTHKNPFTASKVLASCPECKVKFH